MMKGVLMSESQNIEYKESWRDEYLKWICGFANAQGGTIYIGIKDDGEVVGVKNSKTLMEDLPMFFTEPDILNTGVRALKPSAIPAVNLVPIFRNISSWDMD
jgi:hypothetical protein